MKRSGRISVVLALALAVVAYAAGVATLYFFPDLARRSVTDEPEPPPLRTSRDSVVALGRLRPLRGYITISGPPGDRIEQLHASVSETALPDQAALVTLTSWTDRSAEVALLEKQLQDAKRQQKIALTNADIQVELALQKIDELTKVTPLEIDALRAKIPPLEQQRDNTKARRQRLTELREKNSTSVSQQQLDDLALAEKTADAELRAAQTMVEKAVAAQKQGLEAAKLQLKAARESKQQAEEDTSAETIRAKLDLAKLARDRSVLRAPPGTWRVVKTWAQRGELTSPQQPILQLAATGPMIAATEVYETDIQRLRGWRQNGGVTATIRSPALPSELSGTVTAIPDLITRNTVYDIDPAADVDRRVFEVQIDLDAKSAETAARYLNLQVQVELKPVAAGRP